MKKILLPLTAIASTALLSGCLTLQPAPGVGEYYTLDTKKLTICMGDSHRCHTLIDFAYSQETLPPVENAYGKKVDGPNYPVEMARMMLNPPNNLYKASVKDSNGRYYKVPVNTQTNTVLRALEKASNTLYQSFDDD